MTDKILGEYDEVVIVQGGGREGKGNDPAIGANELYIECGGYGDMQREFPDRAKATLYSNSKLDTLVAAVNIAPAVSLMNSFHKTIPHFNLSLIDDKNTLHPAYTIPEYVDMLKDRVEGKMPLTGSDPNSPRLHDAIRKHTVDFCMSGM